MDVMLGEILEVVQASEMGKNAWKGLQAALRSFAANGLIVKLASRLRKVGRTADSHGHTLTDWALHGCSTENRRNIHQYLSGSCRLRSLARNIDFDAGGLPAHFSIDSTE